MDTITITIESELKAQAEALFTQLDLDLQTAIDLFLREAVRCHGLPFEEPNATTYAAMDDAVHDQNMNGPFDSVAELIASLDA